MSDKLKLIYEFEDFRLDSKNPSLWRGGKAVSISPKALEALILLIEKQNEIVSRDELLDTVWKDTFVEEGNINYTISLLRKTLGNKDLIQTVPRRGYRFVGEVREINENGNAKTAFQNEAKDEPTPNTEAPTAAILPAAKPAQKFAARWILVSVFLIGTVFLTSFAFWRGGSVGRSKVQSAERLSSANADAMQAYTRGQMILAKRGTERRAEKAIDEFQNAVTLDPTFALAYAGLAEGFISTAVKEDFPASSDFYMKAKVAAEKSLSLDPNLAEGYLVRGWIKRQADWNWAEAETDLRRAIEIDSKNATAHQRLGQLLCGVGRLDEALSEIQIAYKLDPIADFIVGGRFAVLEARGEYEQALKEAEQLTRENKMSNQAQRAYAMFFYHTGKYEKTVELGEVWMAKNSDQSPFAWFSLLHAAYYKTNQFDKAEENLKRLEALAQTDTKALYSLAMNYAETGRGDEALMNLERCYNEREERMIWIKVEPRFKNLHGDPRFDELLGKMRLSD